MEPQSPQSPQSVGDGPGGTQQKRHWVRCTTACNNRCLFCLDSDTPRDLILPDEDVRRDIRRGREEQGATRVVLSGGEATLHPRFVEFIRYAREQGYAHVQCITNGRRFARRPFLERCLEAGLDEITFSLHGHTPELHDRLTRSPGAFRGVIQALHLALQDGRPVVSVDICLNRQNIEHLEDIVQLCIRLGVTEFDLLHVIPQAEAFEHRDQLFYDVQDHLPGLARVLRLNRHPRYHVHTNRLPASHLEGFEELIQSPRKIEDEIRGRRFQVRAYLDLGEIFCCRQPERCVRCFVEPFCTTLDRVIRRTRLGRWEVWWRGEVDRGDPGAGESLPFGCSALGMQVDTLEGVSGLALPAHRGLYLEVGAPRPLPRRWAGPGGLTLVARRRAALEAWLARGPLPEGVGLEIELNQRTGPWLLEHRSLLDGRLPRVRLVHPRFARLAETRAAELRDSAGFFEALGLPIRSVGFPPCLAPGTVLTEPRPVLAERMFDPDNGRFSIPALARHFLLHGYLTKSARCSHCALFDRCEGAHINTIRHQGFGILRPLAAGVGSAWCEEAERQLRARWPTPRARVAAGRDPEPVHPSLPGFPMPVEVERDPLEHIAEARDKASKPR